MNAPTDLKDLAELHAAAKEKEYAARMERQRIEDQIVALTGLKQHGQKTVNTPGCKITVKPNYSYSLDAEAWAKVSGQIPAELHPTKMKLEVNESKVRALRETHPDFYTALAFALTVKPIRPSVEIVLTE